LFFLDTLIESKELGGMILKNEKMNNKKDVLDEFKELMKKDVSISLDDEIIKDQYRFGFINEETYKELIEDNKKTWNKLYRGK
jgi:hypothetical protein